MDIVINLLTFVEVLVCLLLILIVLMQRPRQEGLGASFGEGVTSQVWGAQTTNVLQKGTSWLAAALFVITVTLAYCISSRNSSQEGSSLFKAKPAEAEVKPADAKPADAKPADAKPADAKPAPAAAVTAQPGGTVTVTPPAATPAKPAADASKPAAPAPVAPAAPAAPAPAKAPEAKSTSPAPKAAAPTPAPAPSPAPAK